MKFLEYCNPCPPKRYPRYDLDQYNFRYTRGTMFPYNNDAMAGPPTMVFGSPKEPDWCTPPPNRPPPRAEAREQFWGGARGGNSLVADDVRDTRVPNATFNYGLGRAPPTLSPRHHQGQQLSGREAASYKAAIQAVNDSVASSGSSGSNTALRGLWKVFDAAVSELGTELNDSLSNKAIFEANVMQETLLRQGRRVSDFEKKSDALSRKSRYENNLHSTLLRLRGSFADVILGTKKEIQGSIDKSFERVLNQRLAEQAAEMEKSYAKKSIATEHAFARQLTERDKMYSTKAAEVSAEKDRKIKEYEEKLTSQRDAANQEITRLHNHLSQSEQTTNMLQTRLNEAEQGLALVQAQIAQERQGYGQALAAAEKGRDDAVTKLSSTLETLQNTCSSAQILEANLTDAENKVKQSGERLQYVEQQWTVENERANLLQQKLEAEVKNKNSLVTVQKELDQHLALERERADLLQQQLDNEAKSNAEVVRNLQEADRHRRGELEHASRENRNLREHLDTASEANSLLKADLNGLQDQFDKAQSELQACQDRLAKTTEMSAILESKVERLDAKVQDQDMDLEAARMSEADVEKSLTESLQRADELDAQLRHVRMEMGERNEALESRLRHTINEMQTVAEQLTDECRQKEEKSEALKKVEDELAHVRQSKGDLVAVRDTLKSQLAQIEHENNKLRKLNIGLESEVDALKDRLGNVEADYGQDREKIATALAGFDEEMTSAHEKLQSVMAELEAEKQKVKELTEAETNIVVNDEMDKQKIEHEKLLLKEEMAKVKEAYKAEVSKGLESISKNKKEIGHYEEAIKMLQKQVDILQELADTNGDCEKCALRRMEIEEGDTNVSGREFKEAQQKLLARLNTLKLEYDSSIKAKDAEIAALWEKFQRREESMERLESLCSKAREDLVKLREEKTYLEGSLQRSIQYINKLKNSQHEDTETIADGIEIVATPRSSAKKGSAVRFEDDLFIADVDEFCAPIIDSTEGMKLSVPTVPTASMRDLGEELDSLLSNIEGQLGFGQCGGPPQSKQDRALRRIGSNAW